MPLFEDYDSYGLLTGPSQKRSVSKARPSSQKKTFAPSAVTSLATRARPSAFSPKAPRAGSFKQGGPKGFHPQRRGVAGGSGLEGLSSRYQDPYANVSPAGYASQDPMDQGIAEAMPQGYPMDSGEELVSPDQGVPEEALDDIADQAVSDLGLGGVDDTFDASESEPVDDSYGRQAFAHRAAHPRPFRRQAHWAAEQRRMEAEEGHRFASVAPVSFGATDAAPPPAGDGQFVNSLKVGAGIGLGVFGSLMLLGAISRGLRKG